MRTPPQVVAMQDDPPSTYHSLDEHVDDVGLEPSKLVIDTVSCEKVLISDDVPSLNTSTESNGEKHSIDLDALDLKSLTAKTVETSFTRGPTVADTRVPGR